MSVFRNITNGVLYVQGFLRQGDGTLGPGAISYVESGATFEASNYYKRFTVAGLVAAGVSSDQAAEQALFSVVTDDGLAFSDTSSAPTSPKVYHETVTPGNSNLITFTDSSELNGPAYFLTVSTDNPVSVYLNDSTDARYDLGSSESLTFSNGELLLNSIRLALASSGASTATVQVIAATIA